MKEVVVLSGKGGTGKTTVLGAFAYWFENKVLVDADVDASNLPLILNPRSVRAERFLAGYEARKDGSRCVGCGICLEKCRFGAVSEDFEIDPLLCEGCGVCAWFCPEEAIRMEVKETGDIFEGESDYGPLIYAELFPGEENSGKLVSEVKRRGRELAKEQNKKFLLVDGPPGIGCPVIAALSGADLVVLVAEPTVSGIHDLRRVGELVKHFRLPGYLLINKADLDPENAENLKKSAKTLDFSFLGEVPYDPEVFEALKAGRPLPEISQGKAARALEKVYLKLKEEVSS